MDRASAPHDRSPPLLTLPFLRLCGMAFFGFGHQMAIQPVLPFLVADRGGDAALVGVVVAVFSIPSVLLRPLIGSAADRWGNQPILLAGITWMAVASLAYMLPSWPALILNRVGHGTAWAAFNTGGHASLAQIAPAARRGEASSIYSLMPAAAQTVLPPLSLLILAGTGFGGTFLLAAGCALASLALAGMVRPDRRRATTSGVGESARTRTTFLEPSAMLPMGLEFAFTSVWPLFFALAPIWALELGIGVEELGLYFIVYGVVFTVARLGAGRISDRVGRAPLLIAGIAASSIGAVLGLVAGDLIGFVAAGASYAAGAGIFTPTALALAVDRADPVRIGSAMATYTLGFQAAVGAGAAGWGFMITLVGFPAPFAAALLVNLAALALVSRVRRPPSPDTRPS